MKTLVLFRGPCGAGKTYIRKRMDLDKVCGYDMADLSRDTPIAERVAFPASWLAENKSKVMLWIEGIFAPNSPSLEMLEEEARRQTRVIQTVLVTVDPSVLKQRIGNDPERLRLALTYHDKFEAWM